MSDAEFVPGVGDLELIGRGTTGSVFRGRDLTSGNPVVVKVLNQRIQSESERDALDDVLESVERLPQGGFVEVVGHGINSAGHPWLLTRNLPRNLAAELAVHRSVPWADALDATARIAESLGEAHRRGIVHGDIRPKDIRIDERGTPLLADVGLAALAGSPARERVGDARREHTAPEVLDGTAPDERTDVYALASVLYEMVSGSPPFGRAPEQPADTLDARIRTGTPESLTQFGVPIPVDDVIRQALAKSPDDRPSNGSDFARVLNAAMRGIRVFGDTTGVPAALTRTGPSTPNSTSPTQGGAGTTPVSPDDPTPVDNPFPDDVQVLAADEAAPLLAAAGRRERRRRRERRVLTVLLAVAVIAAVVSLVIALASGDERPTATIANGASGAPGTDDSVPLDTSLVPGPVVAEGYPFSLTFDTAARTATLSGVASPIGEARLKSALTPIGRVSNELEVRNGPEPDDGSAVIDAVTLVAAMRRSLSAGSLSFDGRTFSISGFTLSPAAEADLRSVIALTPTPVDRPQFSPDPNSTPSSTAPGGTTGTAGPATISVSAQPSSFTIAADGRFHILPLTLVPSGSSTTNLCLASRSITGPPDGDLTMNYSSCQLARLVTIHSAVPGTYTVTDTFIDDSGPEQATTTITFTITVT